MKKKKVILIIILIPVVLLCGALAAYAVMVQRYGTQEIRRWYYEEGYLQILKLFGGWNVRYDITVQSEKGILFHNGEKEKEVKRQEYWEYDNWTSHYMFGQQGEAPDYFISLYGGDEFTITAKDDGMLEYVRLYVWFMEYETACGDLQLFLHNIPSVHMEFQKDYIRCTAGAELEDRVTVALNDNFPENGKRMFHLYDIKQEISSFEIRREADGPMIYFDLDGDGVYEYSCEKYIYVREEETKPQ